MAHHTPRTEAYGDHPDQWVQIVGDSDAEVVVCFIHGGYWRSSYTAALMEPLVERVSRGGDGLAAMNIEYRRESDPFAMQADVRAALRRARELFPDAVRVAVGHSAGGHLALLCNHIYRCHLHLPSLPTTPTQNRTVPTTAISKHTTLSTTVA